MRAFIGMQSAVGSIGLADELSDAKWSHPVKGCCGYLAVHQSAVRGKVLVTLYIKVPFIKG